MHTSDILLELVPAYDGATGEYRTISDRILTGKVRVPAAQVQSAEAWKRQQTHCTSPADVRVVDANIERAHPTSPDFLKTVYAWLEKSGLFGLAEKASDCGSLCKAALFHHDIAAFNDSMFCVVWLEKSAGLELVFPQLSQHVPLHMGTIVVFDAAQPHGVVYAGEDTFDFCRYGDLASQAFLAIDFHALLPSVQGTMNFSVRESADGWPGAMVRITQNGPDVDPVTGEWLERGSYVRPPAAHC